MYKIMIIDDEKAIRNLLRITIENEVQEVEVVGEAASGIEAINTIDSLKPDIIFVDIRMPFMNGIEFSKLAIERYPELKIIVLSAFGEFEYARECIGIGVREYLLKPICREEVRNIIMKMTAEISKEKLKQKEENGKDFGNDSINMIIEYISKNYQNHEINLTSIAQRYSFNASYLSRMFKNKTGMGLIDYLNQYRMDQAIICANKGMLMYITAKEVGIPDPNYFGRCFKKYTGKAYSEYCK